MFSVLIVAGIVQIRVARRAQRGLMNCALPANAYLKTRHQWHAVPEIEGLEFAVYWSDYFQASELLFRNTSTVVVRFGFQAISIGSGRRPKTKAVRSLVPGVTDSPPGHSVTGARGDTVCVSGRIVR